LNFVSGLQHVGGFLRVLSVSSTKKTDRHDITKILLKVALNTIKQTTKIFSINIPFGLLAEVMLFSPADHYQLVVLLTVVQHL
jgi:hypothetical protein